MLVIVSNRIVDHHHANLGANICIFFTTAESDPMGIFMEILEQAREIFFRQHHDEPEVLAMAPGRLELLGNHTDYNEGYVMGLAIDRWVCVAGKRSNGSQVVIDSKAFDQTATFNLSRIKPEPSQRWADYCKGVMDQFVKSGFSLGGMSLSIHSNVPLGAGVSSSAALLVSTAYCVQALFGIEMEPLASAKLCHAAERDFSGANNGLLDHFTSVFGQENQALFLDCRSNEHDMISINSSDLAIAICQTNVKHSIVEGEYQDRRKQCNKAAAFFSSKNSTVRTLRDVNFKELVRWQVELGPLLYRRSRHIVEENERVLSGKKYLRQGDMEEFGRLMYESHQSSVTNFENSCPELDVMVDVARSTPGVWGARLTGGGFGGCVMVLLRQNNIEELKSRIYELYPKRTGKEAGIFICKISDGARVVSL